MFDRQENSEIDRFIELFFEIYNIIKNIFLNQVWQDDIVIQLQIIEFNTPILISIF